MRPISRRVRYNAPPMQIKGSGHQLRLICTECEEKPCPRCGGCLCLWHAGDCPAHPLAGTR